jgi:predicted enzyme related to lactoylglutathione lyase
MRREKPVSGDSIIAYVCTITVADIDAASEKVEILGGEVVRPKLPIPGIGWHAYCTDTESNRFGLMQPDTSAA